MQQEAKHKAIILDFYRRAVSQGDIAFAQEIIANDYIQHSSAIEPGKAGLLNALAYMKQMPKPATTTRPFMRLIAEGDYVVTNMAFSWDGKQKAVVDIFRFGNGKVAEHWDAMRHVPETTLNGNALMNGPLPNSDASLTATNKKRVQKFYEQVLINRQLEKLPDFVAENLIQHIPEIKNGRAGLMDYLQTSPRTTETVYRIIGEADFVVVQSAGKSVVFYDIFRLDDGKLVEMWGM